MTRVIRCEERHGKFAASATHFFFEECANYESESVREESAVLIRASAGNPLPTVRLNYCGEDRT
jgi:hypothetical protein